VNTYRCRIKIFEDALKALVIGCGLRVASFALRATGYGLRVAGYGVTDCMLYIARHRIEFPIDSYQFGFAQNAQKIF